MLRTGGQALPGQQNIWVIWATASELLNPASYYNLEFVPIPPSQITVAGQILDANGRVYLALPNNAEVDVTPMAPGCDYTFSGPSATEYLPQIQANGILLDPVKTNATFCVGQQIAFSFILNTPYGMPCLTTNLLCNWTFPDKFVNSIIPNPPGSTIYTNNPSLLVTTNASCTNWYVNGSGGTVSVGANLILPNGKSIGISAAGKFTI